MVALGDYYDVTFLPPSGRVATEIIDETKLSGWVFENKDLQYVTGGAIRLLPDTGDPDFIGVQFPPLPWDETEWFDQYSLGIETRWNYIAESPDTGGPLWDPTTHYLLIDHDTGVEYFAQDDAGKTFYDSVSNTNGTVIDVRALPSRAALDGTETGAYLLVDDGFHRTRFNFRTDRLAVHTWDADSGYFFYRSELSPPIVMNKYAHVFRFILQDSELQIFTDEGLIVQGPMPDTGISNSVAKELIIGTEGGIDAALQIDWVKQYHPATAMDLYADAPLVSPPIYNTAFLGAQMPPHQPGRKVYGWDKVEVDLEGDTGGTTKLVVDYRSSVATDWTNASSTILDTLPRQTVDLSAITVEKDGSDALRFTVQQRSYDGAIEPARVAQLMVTEELPGTGEELTIYPTYGPQYGSSVAIDLKTPWVSEYTFPVSSNWPTDASTKVLLHFDETGIAPQDSSGNAHHGTIPGGSAASTLQARSGWFGYGIHVVGGDGEVELPADSDFSWDQDVTLSFFTKSFTHGNGSIWEQKDGSVGVAILNNDSGLLQIEVTDGITTGEHIHQGAYLGHNDWVMVWAKVLQASGKIRTRVAGSDWEETTGFGSIDYYTDVTGAQPILFNGCWGTFDEMVFYAGDRDEDTWDNLIDRETTRTPVTTSTVYVDGDAVTGERVHWFWPTRVYVNVPAHAPGEVPIWIDLEGTILDSDTAFRYVPAYKVDVEAQLEAAQACTTKSPFRVGHGVPDGNINLALLRVPPLMVSSHMSKLGLEHLEAANLATYQQGYFSVTDPDSGVEGIYTYLAAADTQDLLISTRSVVRRDFNQGRPLFHKYLLGRGRYYLYNSDALTTADAEAIRRSIRVEDRRGRVVNLSTFAWDIDVSTNDFNGRGLPANTFSVVMHTERAETFGATYYVVFDAKDARASWGIVPGHREVINAVPTYARDTALAGLFEYDVELDDTGVYTLRVTR